MMEEKLPKGWIETTLGEIAKWGSGGTPSRSKSEYYNGNIPWIKTGDLNDSIITEASEFITELGLKNSSAKLFPKGSIGLAMYGATIGKTAFFGIDAATNQACAVAQPYEVINDKFLHNYLKSQKRNFIDQGKGGAQPNISQTLIKAHPILLPPLSEQNRIVAKLDALFGHLDVLREKLDRIPVLLKNFRQQVLTQAVTGELTKEWREYSSFKGEKHSDAEEIIERLNKKRESLVKLKKIRKVILKQTDKNDNLGDLPNSWVKVSLIEVANIIDPNPSHRMPEYVSDGIPFISTENIKGSQLDFQKGKKVTQRTLEEQIKRFEIKEGDFLFTRIGTIGKSCYLPTMREYALSHAVCIISSYLPDQLHPSFLKIILSSKLILDQSQDGIQSVGVPDLGMGKVRAFQIPLTSVEEQQEVVNRVEALGSLADKIESQYQSLKNKIDQLPKAVLAKAFRGELVEQEVKEYVREVGELGMVAEGNFNK